MCFMKRTGGLPYTRFHYPRFYYSAISSVCSQGRCYCTCPLACVGSVPHSPHYFDAVMPFPTLCTRAQWSFFFFFFFTSFRYTRRFSGTQLAPIMRVACTLNSSLVYGKELNICLLFSQVEAGDVILKVNETDVNRFSTKEGKQFDLSVLL
jgi:hypothetical protein